MKRDKWAQRSNIHFNTGENKAINKKRFYVFWCMDYIFSFALILSLYILLGYSEGNTSALLGLLLAALVGFSVYQYISAGSGGSSPLSDENANIGSVQKAMFYYDKNIIRIAYLAIMLKYINYDLLFYSIFITTFMISTIIKIYIGVIYIRPSEIVFVASRELSLINQLIQHKVKVLILLISFGIFVVMPSIFVTVNSMESFNEIIMIGIVTTSIACIFADGIDSIINSLRNPRISN